MSRRSRQRNAQARPGQQGRPRAWKLKDAKAQFNELVVSAEHFAALMPSTSKPTLHVLLSTSPLRDVDVKHEGQAMPVRDVSL
jgi:hypothetical protein